MLVRHRNTQQDTARVTCTTRKARANGCSVTDPSTWPKPSTEYICEDSGYGTVRVRAWANLHPKVCAHEGRGSRGPLPIVVGTLVLVEVERLPRGERRREPKKLWLWWDGPGEEPDLELLWRAYIMRFDLEHTFRFLKQSMGWTTPRVRHPEQADRWTWLVVAAFTQLRLARSDVADRRLPWERRYDTGHLIDRPPLRCEPRPVKRMDAAVSTEVMRCGLGVESVGGQRFPTSRGLPRKVGKMDSEGTEAR
jgi:hypothetical protein